MYVGGDVAYEGYKARLRAQEYCPESLAQVVGLTTAKRAIFQATASSEFASHFNAIESVGAKPITVHSAIAEFDDSLDCQIHCESDQGERCSECPGETMVTLSTR